MPAGIGYGPQAMFQNYRNQGMFQPNQQIQQQAQPQAPQGEWWQTPQFRQFGGDALMDIGAGLASGRNVGEGLGIATQRMAALQPQRAEFAAQQEEQRQEQEQQNQTAQWMQANAPQTFAQLQGGLGMEQAFPLAMQEYQQSIAPPERPQFTTVNDQLIQTNAEGGPASVGDFRDAPEVSNLSDSLTPAQLAVDREFGGEYVEWRTGGGQSDFDKQIGQLQSAITALESGSNLTGPVLGSMPDFVTSIHNPASLSVRESVEEVVQRNLRLILGAQFTQREGERLIARAYNSRLSEAENAGRVERLMTQMVSAANSKEDAARYYEQNGTLQGWTGTLPTISSIESALDGGGTTSGGLSWSVD